MKRFAAVCLLAVLCIICTACPSWLGGDHTPFGTAVALGLGVVDTLHVGADTADQLRKAGTINSNEEKLVLKYLDSMNTVATQAYKPCVVAAHNAAGKAEAYAACAHALSLAVDNPALLQAVHITSEAGIQHAQAVNVAVDNLIQTAVLAFGTLTTKGK